MLAAALAWIVSFLFGDLVCRELHTMTAPLRDWQEHNQQHLFYFEAALSLQDLEPLQVKKKGSLDVS